MSRPTVALVTGFTRNRHLLEKSLAPLRALRAKGVFARVVNVTWDSTELDAYVDPIAAMPDIELIRVRQPKADGTPYQKGVVYQVRNLEAALARVPETDALIYKTRPDFVADENFLARKIASFDETCAPSRLPETIGVDLPASPFAAKIWLPWADANQPFFYEDAAFMGLKRDVALLATPQVEGKLSPLAVETNTHGPFAHVVRFAHVFRKDHPIFARYVRDYKYFTNDMAYRRDLVPLMTRYPFFWHLVTIHAWILANNFHVDCGKAGDLVLYPNIHNASADWSAFESLKVNPPFDNVEAWRSSVTPGSVLSGVARTYGRLVDDSWQTALFTFPQLSDLTREQIVSMLKNVARYPKALGSDEETFFRALHDAHKAHFAKKAA